MDLHYSQDDDNQIMQNLATIQRIAMFGDFSSDTMAVPRQWNETCLKFGKKPMILYP